MFCFMLKNIEMKAPSITASDLAFFLPFLGCAFGHFVLMRDHFVVFAVRQWLRFSRL